MTQWLATNYSGMKYEGMGYMPMMSPTNGLSSTEIDTRWTQDMISHHQGAIDMARKVIAIMDENGPRIKVDEKTGKFRAELRAFAEKIIQEQQKEIDVMNGVIQAK
jgi:uncharacterized protein (DUF305 family)